MMRIEVHHHIHGLHTEQSDCGEIMSRLHAVFAIVNGIAKEQHRMSSDLTVLQSTLDALQAKADETAVTLTGLAQAVVDLTTAAPTDVQAGIDALVVKAQAILDGLTVAEDAADDKLPPA